MSGREQLVAYLATLAALVVIVLSGVIAASQDVTITEAFGIGIAVGGLIGVLKIPSRGQVPPDGGAG